MSTAYTATAKQEAERRVLRAALRRARRQRDAALVAARTDALTGLLNRAGAMRRLHQLCCRGETYCVALIDVDEFKVVNDTWGHTAGDLVLADVALRLRAACAPGMRAVRLGGDEFAVIASCDSGIAFTVLETMTKRGTVRLPNGECSMSAGLAAAEPGTPVSVVLGRADDALYASKDQHRIIVWTTALSAHPGELARRRRDRASAAGSTPPSPMAAADCPIPTHPPLGVGSALIWRGRPAQPHSGDLVL